MSSRISLPLVAIGLLATPGVSFAQTTGPDVTFTVPVNVTKLSKDISKVLVHCTVSSSALIGMIKSRSATAEVPVSGGQAVTTVTVVVTLSLVENAAGVGATYGCTLSGFSVSLQNSDYFSETHALPAFRVTPTPAPLKGSFIW